METRHRLFPFTLIGERRLSYFALERFRASQSDNHEGKREAVEKAARVTVDSLQSKRAEGPHAYTERAVEERREKELAERELIDKLATISTEHGRATDAIGEAVARPVVQSTATHLLRVVAELARSIVEKLARTGHGHERDAASATPGPRSERDRIDQSVGYITDNAMTLIERWGYLWPGQGIDKLEKRLGLHGTPGKVNYMARGDVLKVEVIGVDGVAQLFELRGGPLANGKEPVIPVVALVSTYRTLAPSRIYTNVLPGSSVDRLIGPIRENGPLAVALERARKKDIVLESAADRTLVVKTDGRVRAVLDLQNHGIVQYDSRDEWEQRIVNAIQAAEQSIID